MIPQNNRNLKEIEFVKDTSNTYKMYLDRERILGTANDLTVIEQAIYKILNTERFDFVIYSQNYGIELTDLFGMPLDFVEVEIERRIKEAVLQDDRILSITDFETERLSKNTLEVCFVAKTVNGILKIKKEVGY